MWVFPTPRSSAPTCAVRCAASPNTKLVNSPKEAQAILQQVNDARSLREVSLNAQGRVESYELGINFTFRLIDAKGNALIPDTTLSIYREMPYDDQIVQAKQGQIETLYKAMQRDRCRACCA